MVGCEKSGDGSMKQGGGKDLAYKHGNTLKMSKQARLQEDKYIYFEEKNVEVSFSLLCSFVAPLCFVGNAPFPCLAALLVPLRLAPRDKKPKIPFRLMFVLFLFG